MLAKLITLIMQDLSSNNIDVIEALELANEIIVKGWI